MPYILPTLRRIGIPGSAGLPCLKYYVPLNKLRGRDREEMRKTCLCSGTHDTPGTEEGRNPKEVTDGFRKGARSLLSTSVIIRQAVPDLLKLLDLSLSWPPPTVLRRLIRRSEDKMARRASHSPAGRCTWYLSPPLSIHQSPPAGTSSTSHTRCLRFSSAGKCACFVRSEFPSSDHLQIRVPVCPQLAPIHDRYREPCAPHLPTTNNHVRPLCSC
jgi:hypothetical protein